MSQILLQNVNKIYGGDVHVINDVNLTIDEGEFCVFVGPSGCGKSTLLRMVAGLEEISSGELSIGGQRMNDMPPARRGVAMVFQSYALYPHMSIYDNMAFGLKLGKMNKGDIDLRVREVAKILQLDHLLDRKPKALSGGQRQRVAMGRAMVREPSVFLFDEPLSNLDASLRVQMRLEIARIHRTSSASMIYVTHDQVEAMTLADKIVLLNSGESTARYGSLAQVGAPLDLYHHPRSKFVAGFIGSPKMNFVSSVASDGDERGVTVKTSGGQSVIAAVDGSAISEGEQVTLGIRPEHISLHGGAGMAALRGSVVNVEKLGEQSYLYLDVPGAENLFIARVEGNAAAAIGENVDVYFDPNNAHLFASDDQACLRMP
ncbi:sn-glycerol-3-phosphate ABC transporter ATP-binding protein UgpC, partial [Gammaproteobacteria bacterium]|nr:sn-glycerol-3-phosphate ABC transporter ATP-binding protein UgpC [Gammaproteobacteria bacterium]